MATITELSVNQHQVPINAETDRPLLSVLRDDLHMTGPKYGCGEGKCGACTVHLEGKAIRSCITPVGFCAGKSITTIEGLEQNGKLHALQQAFLEAGAMQCGYCTAGMIMSGAALLAKNPHPTKEEITRAMEGNMCRCGTYARILQAIQQAEGSKQKAEGRRQERGFEDQREQASSMVSASASLLTAACALPAACCLLSPDLEPERYEFFEAPQYLFELNRRGFLQAVGGGILVCLVLGDVEAQPPRGSRRGGRGGGGRGGFGGGMPQELGAWLHISEEGQVTVFTGKVELGQNIRTSLSQVVAEELRLAVSAVSLVMADTDRTPFDMGTFGSRTTPTMAVQLRKVGAAARELLLDLAAEKMKAERGSLVLAGGKVSHPASKQSFSFGELTKGQKLVKAVGADAHETPPADWKVEGTSVLKVEGPAIVTGKHQYPSDVIRPGMLHGKVLRPPTLSATLVSVDLQKAKALPGVTAVHDGDFVGVAAPNVELSEQALDAIQAKWNTPPGPSDQHLYEDLKKNRGQDERFGNRERPGQGSVPEGLETADHKLQATYNIAYIAHAPMEPRAAVAEWQ
ncbi:MAG: molybdopterin-dependent oxidoreductase, partial [Planctomycetes bacterium]|nr:molybdopterin-dependent oxidoreductase [Planctomycetota bacterium]